jgi:hypothetical protein
VTAQGAETLDLVAELADRIATTVTRCPDVAGLTQNPGIPVATYLPGRTVSGVAVRPGEIEICVVARYGMPLAQVAEQVRRAVEPLVPGRVVDVVIGDITRPRARPEAAAAPPGATGRRKTDRKKTGEAADG